MPTMQEFLAEATLKATANLEAALFRLPEDKRAWSPAEGARSAQDMLAECAIVHGSVADVITNRSFPPGFDMQAFLSAKADLAQDWDRLKLRLDESTAKIVGVIKSVPDDALDIEVNMPWGAMTLKEMIAYPLWNLSYHEGQINYIASILGGPVG